VAAVSARTIQAQSFDRIHQTEQLPECKTKISHHMNSDLGQTTIDSPIFEHVKLSTTIRRRRAFLPTNSAEGQTFSEDVLVCFVGQTNDT